MAVGLRDVFTPLFSYVLLFVRSPTAQRSFTALRSDIDRLLAEQEQLVRRHDIPKEDYDGARFAVVAWADETILRHAHDGNPEVAQQWKRLPLQVQLYGTANAGEEFFERVNGLRPAQKDVREIYYLCLCLGFRGRFYDPTQEHRLVQLRRELGHHLPEPVPELLELEKRSERVTPQPYNVTAPPPRKPPRSYALLWAALFSAAMAALVLYLVWPSTRSHAEIVADIKDRIAGLSCLDVTVDFQQPTGTLLLAGHVESDDQRRQVEHAVKAVPEVRALRDTMTIVPRPFCEVVALLRPIQQRAKQLGVELSVRPQKGCDTVYERGEELVFTADSSAPLQHVYVDFYVADRQMVGHLYPGGADPDTALNDTKLTIGGPSSETRWQVEPPFGMELLTVISSPKPLVGPRPSMAEKADAYIEVLKTLLPSAGTSTDVAAAYCFITTEDH